MRRRCRWLPVPAWRRCRCCHCCCLQTFLILELLMEGLNLLILQLIGVQHLLHLLFGALRALLLR